MSNENFINFSPEIGGFGTSLSSDSFINFGDMSAYRPKPYWESVLDRYMTGGIAGGPSMMGPVYAGIAEATNRWGGDAGKAMTQGESAGAAGLDLLGAPQHALFGVLQEGAKNAFIGPKRTDKTWGQTLGRIGDAAVSGMQENPTFFDVMEASEWEEPEMDPDARGMKAVGEALQQTAYYGMGAAGTLIVDPLNFVPNRAQAKVMEPFVQAASEVLGVTGKFLGKSPTWVKVARKFHPKAYEPEGTRGLMDMMWEVQMNIVRNKSKDVKEATEGVTGLALKEAEDMAERAGKTRAFGNKLMREAWEFNWQTYKSQINPGIPDARHVYDEDTMREYIEMMGSPTEPPAHGIPDFVVEAPNPSQEQWRGVERNDGTGGVIDAKGYNVSIQDEKKNWAQEYLTKEQFDAKYRAPVKLYFKEPVELKTTYNPLLKELADKDFGGDIQKAKAAVQAEVIKWRNIVKDLNDEIALKPYIIEDTFDIEQAKLYEKHGYAEQELEYNLEILGDGEKTAYFNAAGQEVTPSPVPLTDIPVQHAGNSAYPGANGGGRRGGTWFLYGHHEKNPYTTEPAKFKKLVPPEGYDDIWQEKTPTGNFWHVSKYAHDELETKTIEHLKLSDKEFADKFGLPQYEDSYDPNFVPEEGGKNVTKMTVSPRNPLVLDPEKLGFSHDWAGHGAMKFFLGDDIDHVPTEEILAKLENVLDPVTYQKRLKTLKEIGSNEHYIAGDMLGVAMAKRAGYDAVITTARPGSRGAQYGKLHEVIMLDSMDQMVKNGSVPHVLEEVGRIEEIIKAIPVPIPKEIMDGALKYQKAMHDLELRDLATGAYTPHLQDTNLSYVKHMLTKFAKTQVREKFIGMGHRFWQALDPKHSSQIARTLRGLGIEESNKLYDSWEGLEIGGNVFRSKHGDNVKALMDRGLKNEELAAEVKKLKTSPGDKFFEDDPTALEIFRRWNTTQLEGTVQIFHNAARGWGWDIGAIRDAVKRQRMEGRVLKNKYFRSFEKGIITQDEYIKHSMQIDKQYLLDGDLKDATMRQLPEGFVPMNFTKSKDPRYGELPKMFKNYYFDPEDAKHLNRYFEITMDPKATSALWEMFDHVRSNWVIGTLYAHPGFIPTMIKNAFGNVFNNALAGIYNPERYTEAFDFQQAILRKYKDPKNWVDEEIKIGDKMMSVDLLEDELDTLGVFTGGFSSAEAIEFETKFGRSPWLLQEYNTAGKGAIKKLALGGKNFTAKVLKMNEKAYRGIENNSRLAHYFHKRFVDGLDPMAARASVKKYLFDYMDLTESEKKLRNLVPFYAWTRNNMPLQIQSILEAPIRQPFVQLGHLMSLVRDRETEQEMGSWHKSVMPKLVKDMIGIPVKMGEDGYPTYFLMGSWVPTMELSGLFDKGSAGRKAWSLLAPYVKTPLEAGVPYLFSGFNKDVFLDRAVEEYEGETKQFLGVETRRQVVHYLRMIRFLNDMDQMTKAWFDDSNLEPDKATALQTALRAFFGATTYKVKPEFGEAKRQRLINDKRRRLNYEQSPANQEILLEQLDDLINFE